MSLTKPQHAITNQPTQCHLWTKEPLEWSDLDCFNEVTRYTDESHFIRSLTKCGTCGQLYYYEMYEDADWDEGNDTIYRSFFPIKDQSVVDYLNTLSNVKILAYTPRLMFDWTDKKVIRWVR